MNFDFAVNEVEHEALELQSTALINENDNTILSHTKKIRDLNFGVTTFLSKTTLLVAESLRTAVEFFNASCEFTTSYRTYCKISIDEEKANDDSASQIELLDRIFDDVEKKYQKDLQHNEELFIKRVKYQIELFIDFIDVCKDHSSKEELNKITRYNFVYSFTELDSSNFTITVESISTLVADLFEFVEFFGKR